MTYTAGIGQKLDRNREAKLTDINYNIVASYYFKFLSNFLIYNGTDIVLHNNQIGNFMMYPQNLTTAV